MKSRKAQQRGSFLGAIIKIVIAIAVLYAAYLLFRYAYAKGDWEFISGPIKALFSSA